MKVLFVASECVPFIKTGGLADVVGALPKALARIGVKTTVLLPAYGSLRVLLPKNRRGTAISVLPGKSAKLFRLKEDGLDLLLLDAPDLFDRTGGPYLAPDGNDWPDNALRYAALNHAATAVAEGAITGYRPDLVHVHDWQAGLVPLFLRARQIDIPTVITIHNIAFQGLFEPHTVGQAGMPADQFTSQGFEYFGKVSFLKAGLVFADAITTVSPTYAREMLEPEFGMGLEGVLASRRGVLSGILNGIDTEQWDPSTDSAVPFHYSAARDRPKTKNKKVLEERFGLEANADAPLFCVISRLTVQKGLDLLIDNLPRLMSLGARLAVLGSGESELEKAFLEATRVHPGRVGVILGYDEPVSHLMQAGSDAIVIPSRFEPCGLTQLYGLRYGTLPIVARTGGLSDTVIDANHAALTSECATGFMFRPGRADDLGEALERACTVYGQKALWRQLVRVAMRQQVGWDRSASDYKNLYRNLLTA